jgi:type IV secretory pathway VirJ component
LLFLDPMTRLAAALAPFLILVPLVGASSPSSAAFQPDSTGIVGLPIIELHPQHDSGATLAVVLSGDGGWVGVDKRIAASLAEHGLPVVGLNSPAYVATKRTPDGAAADLARLLEHYLARWHKDRVILIGYSHGADLAPFMVSRLSPELRGRISFLALLSLENHASFEFHPEDILGDITHSGDLPVLPEVEKLRGMHLLCVAGDKDKGSLCPSLDSSLARVEILPGGHRIPSGQGKQVADSILSSAGVPAP